MAVLLSTSVQSSDSTTSNLRARGAVLKDTAESCGLAESDDLLRKHKPIRSRDQSVSQIFATGTQRSPLKMVKHENNQAVFLSSLFVNLR